MNNLWAIKSIIDAYYDGRIIITNGNDDFDTDNCVYDLSVIMGLISNHVYEALGLNIPNRSKGATL